MPRFFPLSSLPAELAPFVRPLAPSRLLPRLSPTDALLARPAGALPANLRVQPWAEDRRRWAGVGRAALFGGGKEREARVLRKKGGLKWALRER